MTTVDIPRTKQAIIEFNSTKPNTQLRSLLEQGTISLVCEKKKTNGLFSWFFANEPTTVWLFEQEPLATLLSLAIELNCVELLQILLQENALLQDQKDQLLIEACEKRATSCIDVIIQNGANVNAHSLCKNKKGWTPLLHAVKQGDVTACEKLLKHNANVDLGFFGFTPLMQACQDGQLEIVKLLVKHKAGLLKQNDNDKMSPLAWACAYGQKSIVEELVKQKPEEQMQLANRNGDMPSLVASKCGHEEIAHLLHSVSHN